MRRSILIVMLDVMVLSVLALTAGQRSGAANLNIPVPLYRWSAMIEEGLRKEQSFVDQVKLLEAQLAEASEIAKKALEQAQQSRSDVGRERAGNLEMQAKLRQAELDAEKARSKAALSAREAELAAEKSAELAQRTVEMERREVEARERADRAIAKASSAEADALAAERRALAAASVSEALTQEIKLVSTLQRNAEESEEQAALKLKALESMLSKRNQELVDAKTAESAARERATGAVDERERLTQKSDQVAEELIQLREKLAVLELQKEGGEQKVAQLVEEQRLAEEEKNRSVWLRRDEALRRLTISYTEYSTQNDRSLTTRRDLTMPIVQVGSSVLIPADFQKLGLNSSFWGGLSDYVTAVEGVLSPVAGQKGPSLPLRSIIVPGIEPQVCFVYFVGSVEGAIDSISMSALKEQRLKSALLFSPDEVNEHGRVEISPVMGSDYLKVRAASGRKPKVGDYLMSDRGEFIGVLVTKEDCYVTPQSLSRTPEPIAIPLTAKKENEPYFSEFIRALNAARNRVKTHIISRKLEL